MHPYDTFTFDGYGFDPESGRIELRYALEDSQPNNGASGRTAGKKKPVQFTEILETGITLPASRFKHKKALLENALRALHLAGGVSYYKTCLPAGIVVKTGDLTTNEAAFWTTLYEKGLGEFFYRNEIDFRGRICFPASPDAAAPVAQPWEAATDRVLVPVGGGKDSIVTIDLLRTAAIPMTLLRVGAHPVIDATAKTARQPLLTVTRTIDPQLLALNAKGAFNGHVPITAYLHFLAVVIAILTDHHAIVFSNERSANTGSVLFHGMEINHQWSKSLEAERLLQHHIATTITPDLPVFSLLRPLSELRITELFSGLSAYHGIATSCNANWKLRAPGSRHQTRKNLWCGTCPKCAFVFAMLAAFLPEARVTEMFGKNLFADRTVLPLWKELLGIEGIKPFECVGTPDEMHAAFLLALQAKRYRNTPAMDLFTQHVLPHIDDVDALLRNTLQPVPDHAIPPTFSTILPERPAVTLT